MATAKKGRKLPDWMLTSSDEENEPPPLPPLDLPCRIIYCATVAAATRLCQPLLRRLAEGPLCAGFDAEWPVSMQPGQQDPVALIQICTGEDSVFLFHLAAMGQLPAALRDVIQHRHFIKVGVNVVGDIWKLARDFDLPNALSCVQESCVDLAALMRAERPVLAEQRWSLKDLVAAVLGAELPKDPEVRMGSWEKVPLGPEMRRYAALDAFASWMVHQLLSKKAKK